MTSETVTANGAGIIAGNTGEVCHFTISCPPGEKKFNPASCSVAFEGPSKPEIKFVTNKDLTVACSWTPKLPGNYKVYVRYEDKEIKGSPFVCKITGGEAMAKDQVNKIKCSGKGLTEGRTHLSNEITVDTKDSAIAGGLSVSMEGPAKPEINFKNNNNGTLTLSYKPEKAGNYKLHLKFQEIPIPGSPFSITVK